MIFGNTDILLLRQVIIVLALIMLISLAYFYLNGRNYTYHREIQMCQCKRYKAMYPELYNILKTVLKHIMCFHVTTSFLKIQSSQGYLCLCL